mmetsp:Transcript_5194/g.23959  ORF Transcript_5194/g.23959 Transcript_5194/m.23959 type:complete len:394 (-) Transcript_5194:687-1868(-)
MRLHAEVVQHRGDDEARHDVVPVRDDSLDALAQHHGKGYLETVAARRGCRGFERRTAGVFGLWFVDGWGFFGRVLVDDRRVVQVYAGEIRREVTHRGRIRRGGDERFVRHVVEVVRRARPRRATGVPGVPGVERGSSSGGGVVPLEAAVGGRDGRVHDRIFRVQDRLFRVHDRLFRGDALLAPAPRGEFLGEFLPDHALVAFRSRLQLLRSPLAQGPPLPLPSEPLVPRHQLRHPIGEPAQELLARLGHRRLPLELPGDRRGPARPPSRLGSRRRRVSRRRHRRNALLRGGSEGPGRLTPARRVRREFSRGERERRVGTVIVHRRGHAHGERLGLREALQHPELDAGGQNLSLQTAEQGVRGGQPRVVISEPRSLRRAVPRARAAGRTALPRG